MFPEELNPSLKSQVSVERLPKINRKRKKERKKERKKFHNILLFFKYFINFNLILFQSKDDIWEEIEDFVKRTSIVYSIF